MPAALVVLLSVLSIACSGANISFNNDNYSATVECVKTIIKQHFELSVITFVNFKSKDIGILKNMHSMESVSVINRVPYKKIALPNRGYLICARNVEEIVTKFHYLLTEKTWMPYAPFIIVVQILETVKLVELFQLLLKLHVIDVVVVDGCTTSTYTYDPFEKNGCGKRFADINNLGKCLSDSTPYQYYPRKFKNILQNCTINMATTHYPPYSVNHKVSGVNSTGTDEYLFSLLGEHWNFKVNITYFADIADEVATVDDNMVASGSLAMLQNNQFDVVSGSMVLFLNRAAAFTFLYGHTAYDDEFRIIVPRAITVAKWKIMFLEFTPSVWILLVLTFGLVATLIILISRTADKSFIILSLWDILLQHTCRIRRTPKNEIILISWYVFTCLFTYHYLTSLFGLSAKPIYTYQIQTIEDLENANLKPCISDAVVKFASVVSALDALPTDAKEILPQCKTMGQCLETISKTPYMYTVLPYSLYYSDRYRYYDQNGVNMLYSFRDPLSKIIYASFLYKGFPMYDEFHLATLWIRSAGLISKVWNDYEYQQKKQFLKLNKVLRQQFHLPMYIIIFGWIVSSLCFTLEILAKNWNPGL